MLPEEKMQIGRYLIEGLIGSGGMADVYQAKLTGVEGFEKKVAIKKILSAWSGNQEFIRMLVDEAKTLVGLAHANIVSVFELNCEKQVYFMVLEFVDGINLKKLMTKLPSHELLPVGVIHFIFDSVLAGLDYAHGHLSNSGATPIIHRDISPHNILVSTQGDIKISDFGIAKVLGRTQETASHTLKGKFSYMAPEQAKGGNVDPRTDLYTCGLVLFELLAGQKSFEGDQDLLVLEKARKCKIPWEILPGNLSSLERQLLQKALHPHLKDRFQTAQEMRLALEECWGRVRETEAREVLSSLVCHSITSQEVVPLKVTKKFRVVPSVVTKIWDKTMFYTANVSKPDRLLIKTSSMVLLSILFFISASFVFSSHNPEVKPLVQNSEIIHLRTISKTHTVVPSEVYEAKVEEEQIEEIKVESLPMSSPILSDAGRLTVTAIPWGKVSVSGIGKNLETPLTKASLPVGKYGVSVFYAPKKIEVSQMVHIASQSTMHCQVNFKKEAKLFCTAHEN